MTRIASARVPLLTALATLIGAGLARAQEPVLEFDRRIPFATRQIIEIAADDPATAVVVGDTTIARGTTLEGHLLHLGGRLVLEGRVTGDVTAAGSEVVLRPGASIGGRLTVLGGVFTGSTMAEVAGATNWLRDEPIRVVAAGPATARILYEPPPVGFPFEPKGFAGIIVHEYNGVDGLLFGVAAGLKRRPGQPRTELVFGPVLRTERDDVGWDVGFLREFPRAQGLTLGGRIHRITDTNERWHRPDWANTLGAFLTADDDRVYFERTGYELWAERTLGLPVRVRVRWRDDDFESLESQRPFALFADDEDWDDHLNPPIEEGRGRALGLALGWDRRNDPDFTTRGLYLEGRYDHWGFGGDFEFDWGQIDGRGWLPLGGASFLAVRAMAGGQLEQADTLAPQFLYRLGGGRTLPGDDALAPELVGDRMVMGSARLHFALPGVSTRMFQHLYLVAMGDVGDAWFADESVELRTNVGAGIAGHGQTRYVGVFGAYGLDDGSTKLHILLYPWF